VKYKDAELEKLCLAEEKATAAWNKAYTTYAAWFSVDATRRAECAEFEKARAEFEDADAAWNKMHVEFEQAYASRKVSRKNWNA
jgi:hypothetical protein